MPPRARLMASAITLAAILILVALLTRRLIRVLHGESEIDPVEQAHADLSSLRRALFVYRQAHGVYPSPLDGLDALVPELYRTLPLDPWGRRYRYELVGGVPVVTTLGADGRPGGSGENEDLSIRAASP